MAGALAIMLGGRGLPGSITVSANWGLNSAANPGPVTSATRSLTVPSGNPGDVTFTPAGSIAVKYSKNGGAFTTISGVTNVNFASGDSLAFQSATGAALDSATVVVTDATTLALVGSWIGSLT